VSAPNVVSIEVPAQRALIVRLLDSLVEIPLHFLPDLRARVSCDMVFEESRDQMCCNDGVFFLGGVPPPSLNNELSLCLIIKQLSDEI